MQTLTKGIICMLSSLSACMSSHASSASARPFAADHNTFSFLFGRSKPYPRLEDVQTARLWYSFRLLAHRCHPIFAVYRDLTGSRFLTRYKYTSDAHKLPIKGSFGIYGPGAFVQNITQENRTVALAALKELEVSPTPL